MSRLAALVASAVLIVVAVSAGCDSGSTQDATNQQPSVPASGGDEGKDGDEGDADEQPADLQVEVGEAGTATGHFYAYLENGGEVEVAVEVQFSGPAGTSADTGTAQVLPPKTTTVVVVAGGVTSDGAEVNVDVTPAGEPPEHPDGQFTVGEVTVEPGSVWMKAVTSVTNGYPEAVDTAVLGLLCTDESGEIVEASVTQFSAEAGQTTTEEFELSEGEPAGCEAHPRITSNTSFG